MARPEDNINRQSVTIIPPSHIVNYAYDANMMLQYMGHAMKGTADSDNDWTIRKYAYDANSQLSTERVAHNIEWDNRTTSSYE